jgi:vacuolar protein sorting-associated protein 13A/C
LSYYLNYRDITNSGGAVALSIYAPYLVWNMTGLDMEIKSKAFLRSADTVSYKIKPSMSFRNELIAEQSCMFSYDTNDRSNRALIKVGTSGWSAQQSFEAVGQASEAIIPKEYEDDIGEAHLGISVDHGLGQVNQG